MATTHGQYNLKTPNLRAIEIPIIFYVTNSSQKLRLKLLSVRKIPQLLAKKT
jgi:hypothetical protein